MKTPEEYHLSEAENEAIFQKIKAKVFQECRPVDLPMAIIFGGQPGSGKTKAVELSELELKSCGGSVSIVGDDFRPYHPQHDQLMKLDDNTAALFTQHDAGRWVEKAITHAKNIRCNVIIEGTMRVPETVIRTAQELRNAGYAIEARALAVNEKLSWQGILQRYENQRFYRGSGRMTPHESHEAAYSGMLESLNRIETEKLVDKIVIYKRGAVVLYENELENECWKHAPQARMIVENERNRPWTLPEKLEYARSFDKLLELIQRPERNASFEEINAIQRLKNQAFAQLSMENNIEVFQ